MSARLRCPACGIWFPSHKARCPECGVRARHPRRSSGGGVILLAVGGILVVALAGVGWAVWRSRGKPGSESKPETAARTSPVVNWDLKEFAPSGGRFTI